MSSPRFTHSMLLTLCVCSLRISITGAEQLEPCDDGGNEGFVRRTQWPAGMLIEQYETEESICEGDLFFPIFPGENMWPVGIRASLYLFALLYCFLGVSIVADVFMSAIEVITSKHKNVVIGGDTVSVAVWNGTVANLTLMALGSSAPEILLAVIEVVVNLGKPATRDGLGPSTIVGSAAFNLLVISGYCVMCVPDGEIRRIKQIGVFRVTAFFSVIAYVWMLCVLEWISPDVVELWEALITLAMFPVLVAAAYYTDKNTKGSSVAPEERIVGFKDQEEGVSLKMKKKGSFFQGNVVTDLTGALTRTNMGSWMGGKNPIEAHKLPPTSRMKYRIQGVRAMTGRKGVIVPKKLLIPATIKAEMNAEDDIKACRVSFATAAVSCVENCGTISVRVMREGLADQQVQVWYETSSGTATAGEDYIHAAGMLQFAPGVMELAILIKIVDDDECEPDEVFFVHLSDSRPHVAAAKREAEIDLDIHPFRTVAITIIDDDKPGTIGFKEKVVSVAESKGVVEMVVSRQDGVAGSVVVNYETVDGSAKAGVDYTAVSGEVRFKFGETQHTISIPITNDQTVEKKETFELRLWLSDEAYKMGVKLGAQSSCIIAITDDEDFTKMVDHMATMLSATLESYSVETHSWKDQFMQAILPSDSEDMGTSGYVLHLMSVWWKVAFATCPPTSWHSGWPTFVVSLAMIGVLTGCIGDLASMFGCTIGWDKSVTAITIVALGTSLPDLFASKLATINDEHADAALGNVTGSNSVNVFLGIGLPWTIGAVYAAAKEEEFVVYAGSLGFGVVVFTFTAVTAILILSVRRSASVAGAELGGPKTIKVATGAFFIFLWGVYILMSILNSMGLVG